MVDAIGQSEPLTRPVRINAALACLCYAIGVLFFYHDTALSILSIWSRSDTYAHGYLIIPISLWLAWETYRKAETMSFDSTFWPALLLLPGGLAWLAADMVGVLVVQQLALVGILIVGIWSIVGHSVTRQLAFPLGFLFLAVPMGEDLVPPMMELTAATTVWMVKATGIPVFREGLYFTLPSGSWSVVEACSGVRYLIASFTLGLLYAHLSYHSLLKKLLFVLASIVVPIAANSARAYMIVMLGHMSDMTIATGVDHLIYGWLFFGIVMMLLFWIGSFWRDDQLPQSKDATVPVPTGVSEDSRFVAATLIALALAAIWPLVAMAMENRTPDDVSSALQVPRAASGWMAAPPGNWDWAPVNRGADSNLTQFYRQDNEQVGLYLQRYVADGQGRELISGKVNEMIDETGRWRITGSRTIPVTLPSGEVSAVREIDLSAGGRSLLLWYWYRVGGHNVINRYWAKAYQAMEAMTFGRRDSAFILVATELQLSETPVESGRETLLGFITQHWSSIESALDDDGSRDRDE